MNGYGSAPVGVMRDFAPQWDEFMHYLYLPVRIPAHDQYPVTLATQYGLPERLRFLADAVQAAEDDAAVGASHLQDPYIYVTARRGMATPGNPLNRPGWHCDDFGGTDLNYIWSDQSGAVYRILHGVLGDFLGVSQ